MKTTTQINPINPNLLKVTFDIGKDSLYAYTELPLAEHALNCIEETIPNRNEPVLKALEQFKALALQHGFAGLCVLCEPTGGFERRLLRLARQSGHFTAYLNAESVRKLRVVQSNDASKSDLKDPKTMFTLAKLGKTLTHRQLTGPWLVLRETNAYYQTLDDQNVSLRCQIHRVLTQLFCEFSFKKDFLFESNAISHLVQQFGLNPYRIVATGQNAFFRKMKKQGVRLKTLERLWQDAQLSSLQQLDPGYSDLLEANLCQLFEDFWRCQQRLRKTDLYGPYYHGKKAKGMVGQQAMMAVARKFLKLLWGLNRSAQGFAQGRVFRCASQFRAPVQPLAQAA